MSACTYQDGWLRVAYPADAPNLATVHIAVGLSREPDQGAWRPAYLDVPAGVAKVRLAEQPKRQHIWLRVNGRVQRVR